jgi:hypothetical protein
LGQPFLQASPLELAREAELDLDILHQRTFDVRPGLLSFTWIFEATAQSCLGLTGMKSDGEEIRLP